MDRIERHDIINALGLALVLLALAFVLSLFKGKLFDNLEKEDFVSAVSNEEAAPATVTSTSSTTEPSTSTEPELVVHTPAEVSVIVVNSARIGGIATQGTDILAGVGYLMLGPTNGDTVPESVIYYTEGFEGDAVQAAVLLGMSESAIAPVPGSLSFSPGAANLIAVIGADQKLR